MSWKAYAWYSLFFFVLAFIIFLPFWLEGRSLLWNPDAVVYHIPMAETFAEAVKRLVTDPTWGWYDFSIGMGTDIVQYIYQWYMEPLNLFYAFFDAKAAETVYAVLLFVRLYLCGISFLILTSLFEKNYMARVTGALVYVFSGYTLFTGTKAAPFLVAMILLPLIFESAERVRCGKSPVRFMLLIAYSAVFSFYFLFMNSILLAIYVLTDVFARKEKLHVAVRYIAGLIGYYLVGLCIGCVTFLSSVAGFLGSSRSGGARNVMSFLHYDLEYYKALGLNMFHPSITHDYWAVIGFSPFVFLSVLMLLRRKDMIATRLKWGWLVCLAGVCAPLFGCLMNGGKVANNRWLYALVLVGAITVSSTYQNITDWLGGLFGCGAEKTMKKVGMVLWNLCLLSTIAMGGYQLFSENGEGFVTEFHKKGSGYRVMTNSSNMEMSGIDDTSLYRVDNTKTPKTASSAWVEGGYHGLVTNASGYSREMAEYYRFFENTGVFTSFRLAGMDNATILTTLAGVKYYTVPEGQEARIPYGYEHVKGKIYQNKNAVPFSYGYDTFITESEAEKMTPVQKQEAVLQAAIVDEATASELSAQGLGETTAKDIDTGSEELSFELTLQDGISVSEDGTLYRTSKENAGFDMEIRDIPGAGEIYIEWKGLEILSGDVTAATIEMRENDVVMSNVSFQKKHATYSSGNDTYAANVGYSEKDVRKIHVSFTKKAEYKVDEIKVYYLPLTGYEAKLEERTKEALHVTSWTDNRIVGDVKAQKQRLLCLPVIYSDGWKVKVNGKEQMLCKVNLMYCGVLLEEGENEICLTYETPMLKIGVLLSLLGWVMFIIVLRMRKRKSRVENG